MNRVSMTDGRRAKIFRDGRGICHLCEREIVPGEPWHVEHPKALGLGGADDWGNWRPAHVDCHAGKTRRDRQIMADADRALKRHVGLKKKSPAWGKSRPMNAWRG